MTLELALLTHLADGAERRLSDISRSFVESGTPMNVVCQIDYVLDWMAEEGLLSESLKKEGGRSLEWYRITGAGLEKMERLKNAPAPVVAPKQKQKAMF